MFVSNISDTTTPSLSPTPWRKHRLCDTMWHYFVRFRLKTCYCSRPPNGWLDASWLDFAFLGRAPIFHPEVPKPFQMSILGTRIVIFFSLTEAPLPDPTPTPPNTPKRTRNGPETDPKRSQTEPNGPERSQTEPKCTEIKPFRVGQPGGLSGWGGGGGCKGKRKSLD